MKACIEKKMTKNPSHSFFIFLSLSVFCLPFLLSTGCSKKQEAGGPGTPEVTVMTVKQQDVPIAPEYVAQTQSSRQVNINARVSGFLDKRVYTEGVVVDEGQELFLMDQKPFQVQLDQAKAALARQEAAHKTAKQNYERTKPLTQQNALSQKDLDDAKGQFDTTGAAVEQAKAQVEQAKLNLSYTVITSPVKGITSAALQQDGTYINPQNSQLTTVEALSPMWVNFSVSENELQRHRNEIESGRIRPPTDRNFIVEIILVDGSIFPYTGKITFAAPSYNTQTGTFLLRVNVDNPDGVLRPNQFVRVRLKGAVRPSAILVPQRAVQQGSKGHFVWVIGKDDKAEPRPVVVGDWHGNDWFIAEGLKAGERMVVDGGMTVRPGAPVKIKTQQKDEPNAVGK
jgi:membrane fusion protein, multidrug efflux system